jgi:hypothetical protein
VGGFCIDDCWLRRKGLSGVVTPELRRAVDERPPPGLPGTVVAVGDVATTGAGGVVVVDTPGARGEAVEALGAVLGGAVPLVTGTVTGGPGASTAVSPSVVPSLATPPNTRSCEEFES